MGIFNKKDNGKSTAGNPIPPTPAEVEATEKKSLKETELILKMEKATHAVVAAEESIKNNSDSSQETLALLYKGRVASYEALELHLEVLGKDKSYKLLKMSIDHLDYAIKVVQNKVNDEEELY